MTTNRIVRGSQDSRKRPRGGKKSIVLGKRLPTIASWLAISVQLMLPVPPHHICEDSTSFVFQLFFNKEFRGCDWLTKNSSQASKRIKRYCPTEYEGTFIKDACSLSCGDCATSTTITTRTNIFG